MNIELKTFIISLAGSPRRDFIKEQCMQYGLNPLLIEATDLRKSSKEQLETLYLPTERAQKKQRFLSAAEVGCALSHRRIYRQIRDENIPLALVLEDDARFLQGFNHFFSLLDYIVKEIDFDILILGHVKTTAESLPYYYRQHPIKKRHHYRGYDLGTPWEQYGCGTVAYLITHQGADKLLTENQVRVTADDWLYFEQNYHLNILHIRPSICIEACDIFESTIRTEKQNFLQPSWHSVFIRSTKGILKNFAMNTLGMK